MSRLLLWCGRSGQSAPRRRGRAGLGPRRACRREEPRAPRPVAVRMTTSFVSCSKPTPGAETSLATMTSAPFRVNFARAWTPEVVGLGREPDDDLRRRLRGSEPGEDVGRRLQHDVGNATLLLDLVLGGGDRPEVGHRGGHHDHVGTGCAVEHGPLHLGRASRRAPGRCRRRPADPVVVNSVTLAPRAAALFGDGVALLAGAAVADEADRVDRLARAAGGHQHGHAVEVFRAEDSLDRWPRSSRARPDARRRRHRRRGGPTRGRPR